MKRQETRQQHNANNTIQTRWGRRQDMAEDKTRRFAQGKCATVQGGWSERKKLSQKNVQLPLSTFSLSRYAALITTILGFNDAALITTILGFN
jgi:hypothetical protein